VALGLIVIALFLHGFAYLVLYRSADLSRPPDKRMLVMLTGTLALYGSMMLSQAMEAVTRAFYGRGDLDLILSSPVAVWRLFAVRIGAIVVTIAVMSLALAAPFINILAWFSGLRWLAAYGVIVALAMVTVAVAVMLTVGLFRTIGPKHTRLGAQIVAAVIGASFVIGVQLATILSYGIPSRVAFLQSEAVTRYAPDSGSALWLPARAVLGDMLALVVVFSVSGIMLAATICIFAPRFGQFHNRRHLRKPDPAGPATVRLPQDMADTGIARQGMDAVATRSVADVANPNAIALPFAARFHLVAYVP
jgi:ABC-2 type transport system permease protein